MVLPTQSSGVFSVDNIVTDAVVRSKPLLHLPMPPGAGKSLTGRLTTGSYYIICDISGARSIGGNFAVAQRIGNAWQYFRYSSSGFVSVPSTRSNYLIVGTCDYTTSGVDRFTNFTQYLSTLDAAPEIGAVRISDTDNLAPSAVNEVNFNESSSTITRFLNGVGSGTQTLATLTVRTGEEGSWVEGVVNIRHNESATTKTAIMQLKIQGGSQLQNYSFPVGPNTRRFAFNYFDRVPNSFRTYELTLNASNTTMTATYGSSRLTVWSPKR